MFFLRALSTSSIMLLLKNCRRSIVSSPAWHRAPALTVESRRVGMILAAHPSLLCLLTSRLLLSHSAFTDNTQKDLLKLTGNVPVRYEGESQLGVSPSRREVLSVQSSDHSVCVSRPLVQLPGAAVADGLVPLHATHLLPEADVQHGHQGGQARGRSRADLFASVEQLGLCRVNGKIYMAKKNKKTNPSS